VINLKGNLIALFWVVILFMMVTWVEEATNHLMGISDEKITMVMVLSWFAWLAYITRNKGD